MRDFKGPSGLFSIILEAQSDREVIAFLDELLLFGMGYSWGGYESLAVPFDCTPFRTATVYNPGGRGVRFNIGLEDPEDLIADLDRGLAAMRAVQQAG
jgi:cystathionine beta-lyase